MTSLNWEINQTVPISVREKIRRDIDSSYGVKIDCRKTNPYYGFSHIYFYTYPKSDPYGDKIITTDLIQDNNYTKFQPKPIPIVPWTMTHPGVYRNHNKRYRDLPYWSNLTKMRM
jgi:hypothetical protein